MVTIKSPVPQGENALQLDEALHFRPAFQMALGNISRSTQVRLEFSKDIPEPDAYVGRRPAWLGKTIRETVAKFIAKGVASRPPCDVPRSPGRPKKAPSKSLGG